MLKKLLHVNPNSIEALILIGNIEEKAGNLVKALEAFQTAEEKYYALKMDEESGAPEYIISRIIKLSFSAKSGTRA